jgi:hypothetical protein
MTNEEILKKAIKKAIKNGYSQWTPNYINEVIKGIWPKETIIFSRDFAKSFWGYKRVFCVSSYGCLENEDDDNDDPKYDGKAEYDLSLSRRIEAWKYHLQEMVILNDKERINYLEEFL